MKLISLFLTLLAACPKHIENVSGAADELMDGYSAQFEELHGRVNSDMKCKDWCDLKPRVCDLSSKTCVIAQQNPARDDFQARCTTSQEDCARFSDSCVNCIQ
jgi:hypothetical protein